MRQSEFYLQFWICCWVSRVIPNWRIPKNWIKFLISYEAIWILFYSVCNIIENIKGIYIWKVIRNWKCVDLNWHRKYRKLFSTDYTFFILIKSNKIFQNEQEKFLYWVYIENMDIFHSNKDLHIKYPLHNIINISWTSVKSLLTLDKQSH